LGQLFWFFWPVWSIKVIYWQSLRCCKLNFAPRKLLGGRGINRWLTPLQKFAPPWFWQKSTFSGTRINDLLFQKISFTRFITTRYNFIVYYHRWQNPCIVIGEQIIVCNNFQFIFQLKGFQKTCNWTNNPFRFSAARARW